MTVDIRLAILWNNVEGLENCLVCKESFKAEIGYEIFGFRKGTRAIDARMICRPCVQKQEPALLEMVELHCCYAKYAADMTTLDQAGDLGLNKQ
jgi:hypothetical protein